jgi:FkbM family methyltransferase
MDFAHGKRAIPSAPSERGRRIQEPVRRKSSALIRSMSPMQKIKRLVIRLLESRGYCVSFGEPATLAGIISAFDKRDGNFFFVQIGAYDGKEDDPIRQFVRERHWRGLLVEPQPDACNRLKQNYAGCPGLLFENAAISGREGVLPFYKLKDEYASLFHGDHRTLSSLDAEHILKHLSKTAAAEDVLAVTQVASLTFASLLARHGIKRVNLVQIDAEGHDYDIIKTIDFSAVKPDIIRFEHAHIEAAGKDECIALLLTNSYKLVIGAYDITAFQSRWMYD